jgi:hypothetical protein
MRPSDKVWVVPRGYTPQTGCEIKGKVVLIEQYGGGGSRARARAPAPILPSTMLLTEAGLSLLQEEGSYLLLEANN